MVPLQSQPASFVSLLSVASVISQIVVELETALRGDDQQKLVRRGAHEPDGVGREEGLEQLPLVVDDVDPPFLFVGDEDVAQLVHADAVGALVQVLVLHVGVAQPEQELAGQGQPHHAVRGGVGHEDVAVAVHGQPVGLLQQRGAFGGEVLVGEAVLQPPVRVVHGDVAARLGRLAPHAAQFCVAVGGHQQAARGGGGGEVEPEALEVDVGQHRAAAVLAHDLDLEAVVAARDDEGHPAVGGHAVHVPGGGHRDLAAHDPVLLQGVDDALAAAARGGGGGDDDVPVGVDPHAFDVVPGDALGQHQLLPRRLQQLRGDAVLRGAAGLEGGVGGVRLLLPDPDPGPQTPTLTVPAPAPARVGVQTRAVVQGVGVRVPAVGAPALLGLGGVLLGEAPVRVAPPPPLLPGARPVLLGLAHLGAEGVAAVADAEHAGPGPAPYPLLLLLFSLLFLLQLRELRDVVGGLAEAGSGRVEALAWRQHPAPHPGVHHVRAQLPEQVADGLHGDAGLVEAQVGQLQRGGGQVRLAQLAHAPPHLAPQGHFLLLGGGVNRRRRVNQCGGVRVVTCVYRHSSFSLSVWLLVFLLVTGVASQPLPTFVASGLV